MNNDLLTIAAFAAEQLINNETEMEVTFILSPFGPIVQIDAKKS